MGASFRLPVLLLVAVLTKPLLAFVRGHFMALPLLSAWHGDLSLTWIKSGFVFDVQMFFDNSFRAIAALRPISVEGSAV